MRPIHFLWTFFRRNSRKSTDPQALHFLSYFSVALLLWETTEGSLCPHLRHLTASWYFRGRCGGDTTCPRTTPDPFPALALELRSPGLRCGTVRSTSCTARSQDCMTFLLFALRVSRLARWHWMFDGFWTWLATLYIRVDVQLMSSSSKRASVLTGHERWSFEFMTPAMSWNLFAWHNMKIT